MEKGKATPRQVKWQQRLNDWLYDSLAPIYDAMDWLTFGAWWRLVRPALDYTPTAGDVLEIGFGPGKLHLEMAKRMERTFGLDLAWAMCRMTKVRLGRSGRPQRITQGDALALPFPTASFDTIVTTFTLAGLPDGAKAVEEMARVLRTTGRIVMVDIGLPSDRNLFGILLARLWERIGDVLYDQAKLMRDAGLSVEISIEFGPGKHIRLIVARRSP